MWALELQKMDICQGVLLVNSQMFTRKQVVVIHPNVDYTVYYALTICHCVIVLLTVTVKNTLLMF